MFHMSLILLQSYKFILISNDSAAIFFKITKIAATEGLEDIIRAETEKCLIDKRKSSTSQAAGRLLGRAKRYYRAAESYCEIRPLGYAASFIEELSNWRETKTATTDGL